MSGLVSLVAGVALGLSLAAPPGPMNALIAQESVARGWRSGFRAGLGAMTADACFFVLAYAGVVAFIRHAPTLQAAMKAVGGLLLCYFAYGAAKSAREGAAETEASAGFRKTFLAALTNPMQIIWWLTAGVALLDPGTVTAFGHTFGATNGALTVGGFFCGILVWIAGFPALLRVAGDAVDTLERVVGYGSAVVLCVFGVWFLLDAV
ncbi:threonine/homoserine/homoserine lactone efflux protein [Halarchaeum rubridurum]|uniref:Lysine transporter LysE n=1 Tax=Halarchaeum rubridurum TaxID=489911 RepID=A0A830G2F8_9EURY|nr:LysE family translocator [Halarchaeum rubridurum]MBP1955384.1 threonine/homoserine/homoserine lactone efflux protein [Halarchaeum rubridurum]GGM71954.1 lysine transporter LysE [Halarchaeum rubridurum]